MIQGYDRARTPFALIAASLAVAAAPALAGDEVIYAPAPAWITPADFPAALATRETMVLLDAQTRMEGGTVTQFTDVAYRIDSPEDLSTSGTLQIGWQPDKGDLAVHRLELHRDGKVIDLLAAGTRYTVLRRETELESRSLNGLLTATLAVPGLKVGDVVRYSQTITRRDQALNGAMQLENLLLAEPWKAGFSRIVLSWPKAQPIRWLAGPDVTLPPPVERAGYMELTASLPLPRRESAPANAPARFGRPPLLQATSFTGWADVSRRMAPHFATEGAIPAGSPLAATVDAIAGRSPDPLTRAAAALRLVQDDIAYLLNGMNGGNYLPQSPADTWANRYGDCKAKSLLLLAMLRRMGIESEAVLVNSRFGDAVPSLLPMPAAFDHMIVRAVIGGREYWLDGTNGGTRLDTIGEVPPFAHALPLRPAGAELVPMEQRWPAAKDQETSITYDYRAGIDLPARYEATMRLRGAMGSSIRQRVAGADPKARRDFAAGIMTQLAGKGAVYDSDVTYDADAGVATITARGLIDSGFTFQRGRGTLDLSLPSNQLTFAPDRARAAWQGVPYAIGGPFGVSLALAVLLPPDANGMELAGAPELATEAAGHRITRRAVLDPTGLRLSEDFVRIPREIPAADFAKERSAVSRLRDGAVRLRTGDRPVRYFMLDADTLRRRIAPLKAAYDAVIAQEPDEAWARVARAELLRSTQQHTAALADFDKAIALEPSADNYSNRSQMREDMGNIDGALADARAAFALDSAFAYAARVASILSRQGKGDEALTLLDGFDLVGDDRVSLILDRADVMGESGRLADGWALLEQVAAERPGDAGVLNAQCWYMGAWSHRLAEAGEVCDRAVKAGSYGSAELDSRALAHWRSGRTAEALADLDAALLLEPGQASSLFLRGLIARQQGRRADGDRDLGAARRVSPGVDGYFARFGIRPPG